MFIIFMLALISIATLISIAVGFFASNKEIKFFAGVSTAVLVLFGIVVTVFSSAYYVEARTLGIVTSFGRPIETSGPGLSWSVPWSEVYHFPTSSQPLDYDGTDGVGNPMDIKFSGGTTGRLNVNLNWSVMSDDKAIKLWENWREFDKVTENVIKPTVQSEAPVVLGNYTPEDAVKGENIAKISKEILDVVNKKLTDQGVKVEAVYVKRIDPDSSAQERINRQNALNADLKAKATELDIANSERAIAEAKKSALTPELLADRCLGILEKWDQNRQGPFPAWQPCTGDLPALPVR